MKKKTSKERFYIWLTAASFSAILLIVFGLIFVIVANSISHFWIPKLQLLQLKNNKQILGSIQKNEVSSAGEKRLQVKVANRDFYGIDFIWVNESDIVRTSFPKSVFLIERAEYGEFYGNIVNVSNKNSNLLESLELEISQVAELLKSKKSIDSQINRINYALQNNKIEKLKTEQKNDSNQLKIIEEERQNLQIEFQSWLAKQDKLNQMLSKFSIEIQEIEGQSKKLLISNIVHYYQPNDLDFVTKLLFYFQKTWEFITTGPREANTEGGIFPIIFGTVILVFLMSIFCYPLGIAAALYLSEFAKDGWLIRLVRISVSNLAGVPSIVYGIFGLSFFVYGVGGSLDKLFFSFNLPNPTFGTGGVLWASLTLSILTLPVVIVATEEALNAVPKGMKESSLALGATQTQTILKITIPMALPGIITGFVLAIARAAGEVAPLLITGVVKLAPALPIDGNFPFLHLDRKFMHLGFHIFDLAFQSPNVEAVRPIVFVTTLLLLFLVLFLCSFAIILRERLRKKYKMQQI